MYKYVEVIQSVLVNVPCALGKKHVTSAIRLLIVLFSGEGNGNPLQCSCLENPRDGGACWAAVYGVAQSRTRLKRLSSSSSSVVQNFYILYLIYFLTGYNSFGMLYQFLLYNNMSQSHVYIYPFLCKPHPIPTSRSAQSTQLNSAVLYSSFPLAICFTHGKCVYMSMLLSQFIPPFPPHCCVHESILYLCISIPALQIGSSYQLSGTSIFLLNFFLLVRVLLETNS